MGNSVINYPKVFTQFAGDNFDHNIGALDRSEIFIAISIPFSENSVS